MRASGRGARPENGAMAALRSSSFAETWRGVIVAIALGALVLGVFYIIAFGRHWHFPKPAAPKPARLEQRPEESSPRAVAHGDEDLRSPRPPGSADPSGAAASAAARPLAPASSAADALRAVLGSYRADPKSTATASISSSGRVTLKPGGPLTGLDGLPAEALRNGAMVSGGVPAGR
jgi:hypothetical protein